ncbi:MAG TPA: HAD-IC family P-type ATPase [Candidatus Paceibacterota bacterium]|nr:HAD-IC family P-type ATPase [Candidatus Paceibacterota bacterium]
MTTTTYQEIATKTKEEALALLDSVASGLTAERALEHRTLVGSNLLSAKEVTWRDILLRQFRSAFVYLLLAASGIAVALGEYFDAGMIFLFLLLNATLGFFQEFRAEKSLRLLKSFIERTTRVRRDGKIATISVRDVVPGDIVVLDAGDMLPADGYFIHADQTTVDESPISGETIPVEKRAGPLAAAPTGMYEALNIGFSRTTVLSGDAELLVFATGDRSLVGSIATAMRDAESPSAFEEGIRGFSMFILKMVLATIPLVFALNLFVHHDTINVGEFLIFAIALTVSVIPEALPLVTTISLSRGALALAKKQVVPRRLSAIEDLGSIEILCTDKTGTITENHLSVAEIYGDRDEVLRYALAEPLSVEEGNVQNSVFDRAIIEAASEELRAALASIERIDELPFDPVRRRESVLVDMGGKRALVLRGAPESCGHSTDSRAIAWANEEGKKGRRVLAVGYHEMPKSTVSALAEDEERCTIVGMISFADPLKHSTKRAVEHAHRLGVAVKIITGDSKEVSAWVAKEAGILRDESRVITGDAFMALSKEERTRVGLETDVFARTTPQQKLEIISALRDAKLVGFLGEGFNDAPALKVAHVGLAVANASDIAQDASDIILLSPSLETIIDGIREGRKIFANTLKYVKATLTSNFGNFYALALSSLFVPYLPMLPIQVLLLNLLSDFPMISIAGDSVDEEELRRPRGYQVKEITAVAIVLGIVSTIFDFSFFGYFQQFGESTLQTMWFVGSILTELVLLFSIRTMLPFWKAKRPSTFVMGLTGSVIALTIALPFIPAAREVFGFTLPTMSHIGVALGLVAAYFVSTETAKLLFYRWWQPRNGSKAAM